MNLSEYGHALGVVDKDPKSGALNSNNKNNDVVVVLLMVLLLLLLETIIHQHLLHFDCPPRNGSMPLIRTPHWGVVHSSVPSLPEAPSVVMMMPTGAVTVMDTLCRDRNIITKEPNAHLRSRKTSIE